MVVELETVDLSPGFGLELGSWERQRRQKKAVKVGERERERERGRRRWISEAGRCLPQKLKRELGEGAGLEPG